MRKVAVLFLLATLTLAAGCSSRQDPSSGRQAGPQPTGEPIVLGMTQQEGSALGSWPEMREAAEAAVAYVNTELGGVHGRPLKLETCVTNGSPEGSMQCANQILEKKPLALVGGGDLGIEASMPRYTSQGLPYLGGAPITTPQLAAPNSVQFAGWAAGGLPAMALYAADQLHAKRVAVIFPGLPGTDEFIKHLTESVLRARGVTDVRMIPANVRQPDRSAAVSAANEFQPDAILTIESGAGCTSLLQAYAGLGVKAKLLTVSTCTEDAVLKSVGPAAEGVYTGTQFLGMAAADNQPDVVVFRDKLAKYASGTKRNSEWSMGGFHSVMNIYNALKSLPADQLTGERILAELKSARNAPNFLADNFTCDGRVKLAPSVCNFGTRILQVRDGALVDVGGGWIDGSAYIR
jgi:branched-chain amino acid transport system substrate-binding protein